MLDKHCNAYCRHFKVRNIFMCLRHTDFEMSTIGIEIFVRYVYDLEIVSGIPMCVSGSKNVCEAPERLVD